MVNKDSARQAGYQVVESAKRLPDEKMEKVNQIQAILPELVDADGMVSVAALRDLLGAENFASATQGYSLNFAGKGLAKVKADEPTPKCLKVEESQSKNFDNTENVIIRGDNLDVLKILRQNYTGKIKMIYIDPPYNTGNANFIYADKFRVSEAKLVENFDLDEEAVVFFENMFGTLTHSSWLFAMYPRLKLARDLLTDDGVIFISIDDNELANLKLLCDEVFGESNFVALFSWVKTATPPSLSKTLRKKLEYILCYKKSELEFLRGVMANGGDAPIVNRANKIATVKIPKEACYFKTLSGALQAGVYNGITLLEDIEIVDNYATRDFLVKGQIKWSQEFLDEEVASGTTFVVKSDNFSIRYSLDDARVTTPANIIDKRNGNVGTNEDASKELAALLGEKVFSNPKPTSLVKYLVNMVGAREGLVLDFFAGSGTTADAVMQLNAEDGGNRKFILAQWDESIRKKTEPAAHKFCADNKFPPVISSITLERVKRAGEKLEAQNGKISHALDTGYKVFSLINRPIVEATESGQLELQVNWTTTKDILYNMMAMSGEVLLTDGIEEVEADLLYKVNDSYFLLGECETPLEQYASHRVYINGYADIRLEQWLNMLGLNKENVKVLY